MTINLPIYLFDRNIYLRVLEMVFQGLQVAKILGDPLVFSGFALGRPLRGQKSRRGTVQRLDTVVCYSSFFLSLWLKAWMQTISCCYMHEYLWLFVFLVRFITIRQKMIRDAILRNSQPTNSLELTKHFSNDSNPKSWKILVSFSFSSPSPFAKDITLCFDKGARYNQIKLWGQTQIGNTVARFISMWSGGLHFHCLSAKRVFYFAFIEEMGPLSLHIWF